MKDGSDKYNDIKDIKSKADPAAREAAGTKDTFKDFKIYQPSEDGNENASVRQSVAGG